MSKPEKQKAEILGSLAVGGVDELDRPEVRSLLLVDLSFVGQDRWDPSAGAAKISSTAEKTSHASELDAYSQAVFTFNSLK